MDTNRLASEAQKMRFKCKDSIDVPGHSLVRRLDDGFRQLENDARAQKNPASLRSKLQQLGRMIDEADREAVISHMDHDVLRDWIEDCLQKVR
jgi:hypothetical protein